MSIYELFFTGVGSTAFGALIGAWISSRLTFSFQKRLLQQQLDFQKAQAEADAVARKALHDEQLAAFTEFRNMLNARWGRVQGHLSSSRDERHRTQS